MTLQVTIKFGKRIRVLYLKKVMANDNKIRSDKDQKYKFANYIITEYKFDSEIFCKQRLLKHCMKDRYRFANKNGLVLHWRNG